MNRSGPLGRGPGPSRHTPLVATSGLSRGGPLPRHPQPSRQPPREQRPRDPRPRRARYTGPPPATVTLVDARAGDACEHDGATLHHGRERHHRQPRGIGGTPDPAINSPANLLVLCPACHAWLERAGRATARTLGLLVKRPTDPATVPVRYRGRWVLLTADGHVVDTTPPEPTTHAAPDPAAA